MVWTNKQSLIQSDSLTDSTGVGLGATSVGYGINNNVQILQRPSTQATAPVGDVRKDYNNVITFTGTIDAKQATGTTSASLISWELLEDFAQTQGDVYVKDEVFTADSWQKVVVQSVRANKAQDNTINYTLVVVKTT